jgi:hypothetical protein
VEGLRTRPEVLVDSGDGEALLLLGGGGLAGKAAGRGVGLAVLGVLAGLSPAGLLLPLAPAVGGGSAVDAAGGAVPGTGTVVDRFGLQLTRLAGVLWEGCCSLGVVGRGSCSSKYTSLLKRMWPVSSDSTL